MAAVATFYGLQLRWATNGISSTAFGVSALIQSTDTEEQISEVTIPNQSGHTAIWVGYDPRKTCTFEYVAASSATADGNLAITKPAQAAKITVVDSVDAGSDINGTNWIVQSVTERRMSTDAAKITVRAIAYPNIS